MSHIEKIEKYLSKENISIRKIIQSNENEQYSNIIVIPAIAEFENIKKLVESLKNNKLTNINKTLALFVINNKETDSDGTKSNNLQSINYLKEIICYNNPKLKFGFIDCSTGGNELPEKYGGAGFARKIGMDSSLLYFDYTDNSKKILISLDADCLVSKNYLEVINESFKKNSFSSAVINFEHQLSGNLDQNLAIINYEIFIRYYILGLKYTNSPFAFHTIGSTFAIDPEIYVKSGGMNKRKAGEDFYFLQKVAKLTEIHKVANTTVFPSSRISWRVPFGTGPRIKRFLNDRQNEYLVYSPKIFIILKKWLNLLNDLERKNNIISEAKIIHKELHEFLISQNFEKDWQNILKNSKSEKQLYQNIKNWMDGFKTLKLIHYLRNTTFPNENMFFSVNQLFELLGENQIINLPSNIPDLDMQMEFLIRLRSLT